MRKAMDSAEIMHLSYLLAALYWYHCQNKSAPIVLAKVSSTALLTYHVYRHANTVQSKQFVGALLCHCVGDLLMEAPKHSVLLAIPAFFLGHSLYLPLLLQNKIPYSEMSIAKKIMLLLFSGYAIGFTGLLVAKTSGIIQCAIPCYSAVLASMFILACMQKENKNSIFFGALLYVISDNIIGADRFLKKMPGSGYLSWPLYFIGQRVLVEGVMSVLSMLPHTTPTLKSTLAR